MLENILGCNIKFLRKKFYPGDGGVGICAGEIGVHPQQWRDWEAGKHKPRAVYQQKIAQFFKVEVSELYKSIALPAENEVAARRSNHVKTSKRQNWREKLENTVDFGSKSNITLPIWGEAAAATNGQDEFPDQESFETMEIPAGVGVIVVRGDSMMPLAWSGQKVFLRPSDEEPKKGDLVVVWTNESGTVRHYFKRWVKKTAKGVELESVNEGEGIKKKTFIAAEDFGRVRIVIGVWYG